MDFTYFSNFLQGPNRPNGGIKICYQHCELLQALGFDARPLLLGDFNITWFKSSVEPMRMREVGYELDADDIVVCPEIIPYEGLKFKNAKKIIFVQNWIGATLHRNWIRKKDIYKNYYDLGYDRIITPGQYVTAFLHNTNKGEASTITNGIDHDKFHFSAELREEKRVLYFPRKNYRDAKRIIKAVKKDSPHATFVAVNNISENEIVKEYQRADIFLATGYPEGFSLPPLEAMACGCAVVGFTGGGASEFMIDRKTAMVAKDGDCKTAAEKLLEVLKNDKLKEKIRMKGHEKSKEYTLGRLKREIRDIFESVC